MPVKEPFAPLTAELGLWRDQGLVLPLWWRDDDATAPTPALERLLALAAEFGAPLHLAVIPQPASPDLPSRLRDASQVFVHAHGWRHLNHAPPGRKRAEFRRNRPIPAMLEEIGAGRQRIEELFGKQALPIFTPPWNRIAPSLVRELAGSSLKVISGFKPRRQKYAATDLLRVNVHLDPIDWMGSRGLLEPRRIAAKFVRHLRDRRRGQTDNAEPYGLLTHHLVHDEDIWSCTALLLEILARSGVARWTSPMHELQDTDI